MIKLWNDAFAFCLETVNLLVIQENIQRGVCIGDILQACLQGFKIVLPGFHKDIIGLKATKLQKLHPLWNKMPQ